MEIGTGREYRSQKSAADMRGQISNGGERGKRAGRASIQRAGFTAARFPRCERSAVCLDVAAGENK